MKIAFLLLTIVTFSFLDVNAQTILSEDSTFQDPILRKAYIFEHLNLPSILWDNGLPLVDFNLFDGNDNPTVVSDSRVFGMAYASIFSIPKPIVDQLPNPDVAYGNEMTLLGANDIIPIMALNYSYERLKPTAIDDNILYVNNDQLKEVAGNTVSPFESKTSFIASPMLLRIYDDSPRFIVKSQHFFGNTGKTIQSASIDFGDGSGFQSVTLNVAKTIVYSSPGEKTIKIKYNFIDGSSMQNRSKVQIIYDPNSQNHTLNGSFELVHTTTDPGNGTQVDIWVDFNCDTDGIRKPLIFVEGFNPPELGPDQNLLPETDWEPNFDFNNVSEGFNFISEIENEGFDMIYIDYHDGGAAIQNNAAAVIEAIEWINNEKNDNSSYESNVVMGSSMGGLVGKYALRTMEINNIEHDTELFVAIDSPMRGANVPLGFQFAARDLPNVQVLFGIPLSFFVPSMEIGQSLLNRPATRQMLIYQCPPLSLPNADIPPSDYTNFMNEFHGLGDLEDAREISILNGSQINQDQGYAAHTKYFDGLSYNEFLGGGVYDINIWALPDDPNDPEKIYSSSFINVILGIPVIFHHTKIKISDNLPLDTAPGGHYSFADEATTAFMASLAAFSIEGFGLVTHIPFETFSFIPSVSALDKEGDFNLNFDITDNLIRVSDGTTHFKNYIGETTPDFLGFNNHEHEEITNRNSELLRFEMIGDVVNFPGTLSTNYNYGASQRDGIDFLTADFYRTRSRIMESVFIQNAELSINKQGRIGNTSVITNPQNLGNQNFDFNILTNCSNPTNPILVTATTNGLIRIGDNSFGNTSTTYVHDHCKLQAINGSEIRVESGSNLHILSGAELNVNSSAQLILEPNVTVEVHPDAELMQSMHT